jgi:hypothetical protein
METTGFIHRFEKGQPEKRPLLLLHGTGGDENDLIPLPDAPISVTSIANQIVWKPKHNATRVRHCIRPRHVKCVAFFSLAARTSQPGCYLPSLASSFFDRNHERRDR